MERIKEKCYPIIAHQLAVREHGDQKYGIHPYVKHLRSAVSKAQIYYGKLSAEDYELLTILCWLHDLFEDTKCTEEKVREEMEGYARLDELIKAMHSITKRKGESRDQYISRLLSEAIPTAIRGKIADTMTNLEESLAICDSKRVLRYSTQLTHLNEQASKISGHIALESLGE